MISMRWLVWFPCTLVLFALPLLSFDHTTALTQCQLMMAFRRWWLTFCFVFGISFLTKKEECLGFMAGPAVPQQHHRRCHPTAYSSHHAQHQHQHQACSPLLRRRTTGAAASLSSSSTSPRPSASAASAARIAARTGIPPSRTALHATGFGPAPAPKRPPRPRPTAHPTPDPSAYYPNEDEEDTDDDGSPATEKGDKGGDGQPFPELGDAKKVQEPRGIGTLFESEDEVIRELSSEEYLDVLKEWAPIASFASVEAVDAKVKKEASCILTVLRGMAVSTAFLCVCVSLSLFLSLSLPTTVVPVRGFGQRQQ